MDLVGTIFGALQQAIGPEAAIYALAAIGLNIHFGYTGLLNFGQVGFMLVGGYGLAISVSTFGLSMPVGVLVGLACAVLLALLLGAPTLRLRADYLAITTIAAGEILRLLYRGVATDVTGGVYGLQQFADGFYDLNPFPRGLYGIGRLTLSARDLWIASVCWALVAVAVILVYLLVHSPWGRVLKGVREDEEAVRALGKNVFSYKMQSLVLGGAIGGLAGVMFAVNFQSVNPDTFNPVITFNLWAVLILGGAARVLGPVLGAVIFWFFLQFVDILLRSAIAEDYITFITDTDVGAVRMALVGLVLMLLIVYRPAGIIGNRKEMALDGR